MSDDTSAGDTGQTADPPELPAGDDPAESIEGYEADGGLVLYDAENPLAWVKGSDPVPLEEQR